MSIPLSALFFDENFYRHLELESRRANKDQRLLDAFHKELCAIALKQARAEKHHKDYSKAAGEKSARIKKEELRERNSLILAAEKKLIEDGENHINITGKLADRYGLKAWTINRLREMKPIRKKKTPTLVDVPLIIKNVLTETNPKGDER